MSVCRLLLPAVLILILYSCATDPVATVPYSAHPELQSYHESDSTSAVPAGDYPQDGIRIADVVFADDLAGRLFYPPDFNAENPVPMVIIVNSWSDSPDESQFVGYRRMDTALHRSWAARLAASGVVAVTYESHDVPKDSQRLIAFLYRNRKELGVDIRRTGLMAFDDGSDFLYAMMGDENSPLRMKAAAVFYPDFAWLGPSPSEPDAAVMFIKAGSPTVEKRYGVMIDMMAGKLKLSGYRVEVLEHPRGTRGFIYNLDDQKTRDILQSVEEMYHRTLVE